MESAKIKFSYDKGKRGELLLLKETGFLIKNVGAKTKKIIKVEIDKKGHLINAKDSDLIEMDKVLVNTEIPKVLSVKETLFEDLKKIIGKDIEIVF